MPIIPSRVQLGFNSQGIAVRSAPAETTIPLATKARAKTGPLCPWNISIAVPLSAFHV